MSYCYNDCLSCLVNNKVIIHCGCHRYCVVICEICPSYIKAIDVKCGSIKIFNFDRVDFIEKLC